MNRTFTGRGIFLSAVILLGWLSSVPVRGDDKIDNPKYQSWANFKPGSSSTVAADMDVSGNKIHIEMTRTLISIDGDNAVVETKSTVNVMGHDQSAPPRQEIISAKTDKDDIKPAGEKEVDAMGKTFKCKVYEAKGDSSTASAHAGPNPDTMKATIYVSSDVPGGLVRLEGIGQNGKELTFILTAMESK